jgi:1,2-phenylacetyl-CoA epoxidase PaaB subunit
MQTIGDEPVYEVFARRVAGEPLRHVGSVAAPGDALARVYARSIYDEESWIEMYVVPRRAIIAVDDPVWRGADGVRDEAVDVHA